MSDQADLGRVQRVDGPSADLVVLGLYHPGQGRQNLAYDARTHRVAWVDQRPSGAAADGFVRRLRNLLTGAIVLGVDALGARRRLRLRAHSDEVWVLTDHEHAPCLRRLADGFPLAGRRRFATEPFAAGWTEWKPPTLDAIPGPVPHDPTRPKRRQLEATIRKLDRKVSAVEADAARVTKAPELRSEATFILAHLGAFSPGSKFMEALDTSVDPPRLRQVALDPRRDARDHANRLFHEARRMERGAELARARLETLRGERDGLAALVAMLDAGATPTDVENQLEARSARERLRAPNTSRRPFRVFEGAGNRPIHVGRSARDNDTLTTAARPHDRWLHARGRKGAHVVIPLDRSEACPSDLLVDAAHLAAHFSDCRDDERVEIQHAERRHVHKRKGSSAGSVTVTHDKTLLLRVDRERLRWLLERER